MKAIERINKRMKVVFISNYYNHHQSEFSEQMNLLTDGNYRFIETEPMDEERKQMGWSNSNIPSFVIQSHVSEEKKDLAKFFIDDSDIAIIGSASREYVSNRLRAGKIVVNYTERLYKQGYRPYYKFPIRSIKFWWWYKRYKNLYLLCASAYTAADYAITGGCFLNKTYKWGYFTQLYRYDDINAFISEKTKNSILWAARLIDWKHPELAIRLALCLRDQGYNFTLKIIGNGELYNKINQLIIDNNLEENVQLLGAMPPNEVRKEMEKSEIFIFTSDFNEGWGAVLNESMNSGCAVVASHAIGSVPFLIQDNENGMIYQNGNIEDLSRKVKYLLDNPDRRKKMGASAYETISREWNAQTAASRFMKWAEEIAREGKSDCFSTGPLSRSKILFNNWYETKDI